VREDTLFTDASGVEKSGIRKRAEQNLQQASEVLSRLLLPNETVLCVSRGAFMPSFWQQLLESHGTTALGALLVLTNARLIVLRIKSSGLKGWTWDQGILTVEWANLAQAARKGWLIGCLDLKDQAGRRERFFRMPWGDLKKLRLLLNVLVPQGPGLAMPVAPTAAGFVSLCPKCLAVLAPGLYQCAQCRQEFKDEKSLLTRTMLIPGGAYFYSGQTLLGILAGLIETVFILLFIVSLAEAGGLIPLAPAKAGEVAATPSFAFVEAVVFLIVVAITKFTGFYRVRPRIRKFIPA